MLLANLEARRKPDFVFGNGRWIDHHPLSPFTPLDLGGYTPCGRVIGEDGLMGRTELDPPVGSHVVRLFQGSYNGVRIQAPRSLNGIFQDIGGFIGGGRSVRFLHCLSPPFLVLIVIFH